MIRRYVEQLLSIYNYIDGILVTDSKGYIEYFATYRPDVNKLKEKNILHKHITEVYPELTEEDSISAGSAAIPTLTRCLRKRSSTLFRL